MASSTTVIELQESPQIAAPASTFQKDGHILPASNNTLSSHYSTKSRDSIPDPERTEPTTPVENEVVEVAQTLNNPPMNKWRLLSACLMNLGGGLNDSAPGALIPYMEKEYNIGYAVVSLIFVTNAIGFILAAPATDFLESRFGRSRTYALSLSLIAGSHIAIICQPPFPVIVVSFFFIGFGLAVNVSLNNVFCANLVNNTAALGAVHGAYGIGGIIGPLAATAIASHGTRWAFFYFITLVLSICNIIFSWWSFLGYEKEFPVPLVSAVQNNASLRDNNEASVPKKSSILKQAIKNRVTILGALFIFAYQGAEVSISGWVVSFLVAHRGADVTKIGYVTSGFWGGITLGRFLLSHPAHKIGRKLAVTVLVIGSAAFQLLVWLIPNIIGDAVALSIVGLLLGPIYPCACAVFTALLPRHMQLTSLSFISAMGSSGGAAAPFFTGLLAQSLGTVVLHPICIILYAAMIAFWAGQPKIKKRSE